MKTTTNTWIIISVSLIVIGLIIFSVTMSVYGWDFHKLSTTPCTTKTHNITEEFNSLTIDIDTADVVIKRSEDNKCSVVCCERKNIIHKVSVENNVLTINVEDNRKWYDYLGFSFDNQKITVYLPSAVYDSITVDVSTGDIEILDNFDFNKINISTSTGDVTNHSSSSDINIEVNTGDIVVSDVSTMSLNLKSLTGDINCNTVECDEDIIINVNTGIIKLTNINCKNLTADSITGDILLDRLVASLNIRIETNTGDVDFNASDASELYIKTNTGDVSGNLLTNKCFYAQTNTGDVDVPKSQSGGLCEIHVNTGDIEFEIV